MRTDGRNDWTACELVVVCSPKSDESSGFVTVQEGMVVVEGLILRCFGDGGGGGKGWCGGVGGVVVGSGAGVLVV